jgi:hypothetical protein
VIGRLPPKSLRAFPSSSVLSTEVRTFAQELPRAGHADAIAV